jgi:DNA-directed RNA polymerase subunit H (RpoH/RPB5)
MEKALKTLVEMFYDRSLFDPYYKDIHGMCEAFILKEDNKLIILPCTPKMCVIFDTRKKPTTLEDYTDTYKHIVFITKGVVKKQSFHGVKIEYFTIQELSFNISRHVLVPSHKIVMKDKQKIMNDYNLKTLLMLPHILYTDPMAKYIGALKGDVVEVIRQSISSGEHRVFRICV